MKSKNSALVLLISCVAIGTALFTMAVRPCEAVAHASPAAVVAERDAVRTTIIEPATVVLAVQGTRVRPQHQIVCAPVQLRMGNTTSQICQ